VIITRFGPRTALLAGMTGILAGLVLFTRAPVGGGYAEHVLPVMVLLGAGCGTAFPALMTLSMSGATPSDAGLASGLVNTTLQVGGALGLAVMATLSATRTGHLRAAGEDALTALNGGYHLAYWVGAALVVVAIAVALAVLEPARRRARAPRAELACDVA
jgi:MFS family permease